LNLAVRTVTFSGSRNRSAARPHLQNGLQASSKRARARPAAPRRSDPRRGTGTPVVNGATKATSTRPAWRAGRMAGRLTCRRPLDPAWCRRSRTVRGDRDGARWREDLASVRAPAREHPRANGANGDAHARRRPTGRLGITGERRFAAARRPQRCIASPNARAAQRKAAVRAPVRGALLVGLQPRTPAANDKTKDAHARQ